MHFHAGMEDLSFIPPAVFSGKKIALVVNTAWNFWNFRRPLIQALQRRGCQLLLIAPEDTYLPQLCAAFPDATFITLRKLSRKSLSPWSNFQTFWELKKVLAREQPDCSIFFTIKPNIFGSFAAFLLRLPAIAVVTGTGYAGTAPWLLRNLIFQLYRLAFRHVQRVIFQNYDDRREFVVARAVAPEKAVVIKGSGIDTQYFAPAPHPANPAPVFLFVGRLLREKGIREFVQAAIQVRAQIPGVQFRILGSPDAGHPDAIRPDELRRWMAGGGVEYLGQVEDVRPFLQQVDALVLPSYYREGMPRALLEGLAMGLPLITTDSVGCRDTVETERNGFIVPAGDADALAAALFRFILLPESARAAMGRYSREKALREFAHSVILPRYLEVLGAALTANGQQ